MKSYLGLGLLEEGNILEIWKSTRDKVITRAIANMVTPIAEEIIKDRLSKIGIIKWWI